MTGVRKTATSWQVYARRDGHFYSKRFPLDTAPDALQRERDKLIGRAVLALPEPSEELGSFKRDAAAYLTLVTHMPSYDDRAYDIGQWVLAFGDRPRSEIQPRDMRATLETWRASGRADGSGGLSASSLNKRRTALMHLYTVLDGKAAANPVKNVPPYDESASETVRALPPRFLARVIARVGKHAWKSRRPAFKGKSIDTKTKARLWLMLCTGWPPKQIGKLTAADIDWKQETVWIARRQKGKGAKGRRLPLVPGAINAVRKFQKAEAWGAFSTSGMHKAFQRAFAEENAYRKRWKHSAIPDASPYACRHTFGTELAKVVKDERVIMEMMLLTNARQVRRYTEAATTDRLEQARAMLKIGAKVAKPHRRVAKASKSSGSRRG